MVGSSRLGVQFPTSACVVLRVVKKLSHQSHTKAKLKGLAQSHVAAVPLRMDRAGVERFSHLRDKVLFLITMFRGLS